VPFAGEFKIQQRVSSFHKFTILKNTLTGQDFGRAIFFGYDAFAWF
jgi:hypothetical protein